MQGEVIIVQQNQPQCIIIAPENPTPQEKFAISELVTAVERFTGVTLKSMPDSEPLPTGNVILIGVSNKYISELQGKRLLSRTADLPDEGYILSIVNHGGQNFIVAAANDEKGVIYGVYALVENMIERLTGMRPVDQDFNVKQNASLSIDITNIRSSPFYPLRCALSQEDPTWMSQHRLNISGAEGVWTGTGIDDGLGTAFKYVTDGQFDDMQDESFSKRLQRVSNLTTRLSSLKSKGIDSYLFMYVMGEPTKAMMENHPELLGDKVQYENSRNGEWYKPISWTNPETRAMIKKLVRSIVKTYSPWLTGFHLRSWGAETRAPAGNDEEQQKLLWDVYFDVISAAREVKPDFKFLISGYDESWLRDPKREYAAKLPSGTILMCKWGVDGEPTRDPEISVDYINSIGKTGLNILVFSHDVEEVMPLWMLEGDLFVDGVRKYANDSSLKSLGGFTIQGEVGFSHLDKIVSARIGWDPYEDYVSLMRNYLASYYGTAASSYILNSLRINSLAMSSYFSDLAGSLSLTGKYGNGSRSFAIRFWNLIGSTAVKDTLSIRDINIVEYSKERFNSLLPSQQESANEMNMARSLIYSASNKATIDYYDGLHLMRMWVRFFESRLCLIEALELGFQDASYEQITQKIQSAIEYSREMRAEISEINSFVKVFNYDDHSARMSLMDSIDQEIEFLENFDPASIIIPEDSGSLREVNLSIKEVIVHPSPVRDRAIFCYRLTASADNVNITIYSIKGRKVRDIIGVSGKSGYNEHTWMSESDDGIRLATGVYIYKIVVKKGEEKAQAIGKLAIVR